MRRSTPRRFFAVLVPVLALAFVASACSSSSKTGSKTTGSGNGATTTTGTNADTALLGPNKPATGTPVKIGFVSDGKSEAVDNSSETPAAEAAAKYVNEHLGGIAGHPITLDTCSTNQTPSGAQDCVTQFITDKVVAVANGVSGQGGTVADGLGKAGIPFIAAAGIDQKVLLSTSAFVLQNGVALGVAGPIVIAQQNGTKKAAVIVTDVPAAAGPISAIAPTFYKNAGVDLQIVKVAPGTADMTPQVQTAISAGVKQFALIGNAPFCQSAIQALKTLGFSGTLVLIPQCLSADVVKAVDVSGARLVTGASESRSDKEVALFDAVMAKYAPGASKDSIAEGGYIAIVGMARGLAGLTGAVTPASVKSAMSTMAPAQLPMAPAGVTFQCGKKIVAITPAICTAGTLLTTLDKNGNGDKYINLDTSAVTKL